MQCVRPMPIDQLLAVKGKRTVENTLRFYDDARNQLTLADGESWLMYRLAPPKDVRDAGQAMNEKASAAETLLNLNQDVYRALQAMDLSDADPATKHYVERIWSAVDRSAQLE